MNQKTFFKKHGKTTLAKDISVGTLYEAFKARLLDETSLLACNCAKKKAVVARPGGWVCPVHGTVTVL